MLNIILLDAQYEKNVFHYPHLPQGVLKGALHSQLTLFHLLQFISYHPQIYNGLAFELFKIFFVR